MLKTQVFGVTPFFACDGRFYGAIGTSTVACSLAFGTSLLVAGLSEGQQFLVANLEGMACARAFLCFCAAR